MVEVAAYQPQQSVLKRHCGQRQTACIRYISDPQRSQTVRSSAGPADGAARKAEITGVMISWGFGLEISATFLIIWGQTPGSDRREIGADGNDTVVWS